MGRAIVELIVAGLIWWIGAIAFFMAYDSQNHSQTPRERPAVKLEQKPTAQKGDKDVAGDDERVLNFDGRERHYLVYRPHGTLGSDKRLPVVLLFHGGGGRAEGIRTASQMNSVAERYGFIVVYPEGTGLTRLLTYNAGSCCGYAVREHVDDVGFVRQLIDELPKHYPVDKERVYASGFSNGAMLCYRLACELSDKIAAIAPVSGDMGVDGPKPARPVPIIHFHGLQDQNSMFAGGKGKNQFQPVPHRSIPDTLAFWIKWNNCRPKSTETTDKDYVRDEWSPAPGENGAPIVLYKLPEGGHTWPGGIDTTPHLNTGKLIKSVDASTLIWKFFEQHTLAGPEKAPRQ